jgi:hypothetical protein
MEEAASRLRKLIVNILNKQAGTADKGWSSVGFGQRAYSHHENQHVTKCYVTLGFGLGHILCNDLD